MTDEEGLLIKPPLDELLDTDLQDMISCMAKRYAYSFRKNPHASMISHQDLIGEGNIGLMLAYQSFDPSIGETEDIVVWFRTHAFPYIKNAMTAYCRRFSHTLSISERSSRYDYQDLVETGVLHYHQVSETEDFDIPIGSGLEVSHDIDDYFFKGFTELEANFVKDYVLNNLSLSEISKKYNISKTRVGEIIRGLMDRMRERADKYVEED